VLFQLGCLHRARTALRTIGKGRSAPPVLLNVCMKQERVETLSCRRSGVAPSRPFERIRTRGISDHAPTTNVVPAGDLLSQGTDQHDYRHYADEPSQHTAQACR
jgi:hypothetical protein